MRSDSIVNPLGRLTPEEKERLACLLIWCIDGPEQGMINVAGYQRALRELREVMEKNGIKYDTQAEDQP